MSSIIRIQTRLKNKGLYKGPIDGDFGPASMAARIVELGAECPPWLIVAARELGVQEWRGGENPRIIEYHKHTTLKATEDEIAWCSSFANFVMDNSGYPGTKSAAASSWLPWGRSGTGTPGAIAVFTRPGGNHVAFVVEAATDGLLILGGNQSDKVCVQLHSASTLRGFRWPK